MTEGRFTVKQLNNIRNQKMIMPKQQTQTVSIRNGSCFRKSAREVIPCCARTYERCENAMLDLENSTLMLDMPYEIMELIIMTKHSRFFADMLNLPKHHRTIFPSFGIETTQAMKSYESCSYNVEDILQFHPMFYL
jgi:hypothetical protein